MSEISEVKKQLLEKGFCELYEPEGVDLISVGDFKLINMGEERSRDNEVKDIPEELANRLGLFAQYIKAKYIDPNWENAKFNKFAIWEGIDEDSMDWHTDKFETWDIFFLYYLSDTYEETGGSIEFEWEDNRVSIQPKAGTLILINNFKNSKGFWHRAVASKITRYCSSFDFIVEQDDEH